MVQPDGKCAALRALFAASRAFIRPRNIVIACAMTEEKKEEGQHPQGISYINPLSSSEGGRGRYFLAIKVCPNIMVD